MPQNSLKACALGIEKAKTVLTGKGWSQLQLAKELQVSRQPVDKFFRGEVIKNDIFVKICQELKLDWQEVTGKAQGEEQTVKITSSGIDALVQEVRKKLRPYYENCHNTLKVLGMREPIKLESVYTAVQFLDDEDIDNSESTIENLEKYYRQINQRRFQFQVKGKQEGIKVANDKQYLMVLGSPGVGKSTFLKKIVLEALKNNNKSFRHFCIPIFIELKDFINREFNIENTVLNKIKDCKFSEFNQFQNRALLEEGKLLIVLDGLDEVPTQSLSNVINHIQYFVDTYDKNRFILSCRIAAYRYNLRRFTDVIIADFDDIQIENFINNWFSNKQDIAKDCWDKLKSDEYIATKELTQTPLLLTFVCLSYQRSLRIPTNRATLYERVLRILLEEWAGVKEIPQEDIYKGLDTKRKEMILSQIAHDAFKEDRLFLSRREIAERIEELLLEMLPDEKFINGVDVLKFLEIQHGVLVERADSIYSFSHLTLQEYLTAQYIDDYRLTDKLVTEHLTEKRWREVFLLVAGLMRGGTDNLLLLMEKEAQKYIINNPKLQALLNWAEQVTTGSKTNLKPMRKRAIAITRAYANAIAIANAIANTYTKAHAYTYINTNASIETYASIKTYANAIANANANLIINTNAINNAIAIAYDIANANPSAIAIAIKNIGDIKKSEIFNNINFTVLIDQLEDLKVIIPDDKQPEQKRLEFAQHFQQTLLSGFNLTLEMIDLSEKEAKALENYLYVIHLIIQCKQASVRVSPTTWENIEARMLLFPSN